MMRFLPPLINSLTNGTRSLLTSKLAVFGLYSWSPEKSFTISQTCLSADPHSLTYGAIWQKGCDRFRLSLLVCQVLSVYSVKSTNTYRYYIIQYLSIIHWKWMDTSSLRCLLKLLCFCCLLRPGGQFLNSDAPRISINDWWILRVEESGSWELGTFLVSMPWQDALPSVFPSPVESRPVR